MYKYLRIGSLRGDAGSKTHIAFEKQKQDFMNDYDVGAQIELEVKK